MGTAAVAEPGVCAHREVVDWVDGRKLGVCQRCGQVREYPWDGHGKAVVIKEGHMKAELVEKHRYYEENREAIIQDYRAMGQSKMLTKWGMPQSTWNGLRRRWGVVLLRSRGQKRLPAGDPAPRPAFPEFCNEWSAEVQMEWFDTYVKIFG